MAEPPLPPPPPIDCASIPGAFSPRVEIPKPLVLANTGWPEPATPPEPPNEYAKAPETLAVSAMA